MAGNHTGSFVPRYLYGIGSVSQLRSEIHAVAPERDCNAIFILDEFFRQDSLLLERLRIGQSDQVIFIESGTELTTAFIDKLVANINRQALELPRVIVGVGGGTTLDVAKALSCLMTNGGPSSSFQGWDLLSTPCIPKIGIPSLPGTGAEASRTSVLTNAETGLKLGMNSDLTRFDSIILDPLLAATVPTGLLFVSATDAFFHSIEILSGEARNPVADALARQALVLIAGVFDSTDMTELHSRGDLMVASFLAGSALAGGTVGLIHPFSAGLSVVLGIPHTLANCIVMRAMEPYYPDYFDQFWGWVRKHKIKIPKGVCSSLSEQQMTALYNSTIVHARPLKNHFGENFSKILTVEKVAQIFRSI